MPAVTAGDGQPADEQGLGGLQRIAQQVLDDLYGWHAGEDLADEEHQRAVEEELPPHPVLLPYPEGQE